MAELISEYAEEEIGLKSLLMQPGRFLDVGSGAGWISISMAERWPALQVDGLDILQPALDLANENAGTFGLSDRVTFHNRSVDDFDAADAYSTAFIPFIFIPEAVLRRALPALHTAVQDGGWLFVACYRKPEAALDIALWDLQTTMSGGRVWDGDEIAGLLEEHSFRFVKDIGEGTPVNLYATCKA